MVTVIQELAFLGVGGLSVNLRTLRYIATLDQKHHGTSTYAPIINKVDIRRSKKANK